MKKANPLFRDSTKMAGDTVATKVELSGISPFEGELIQIRVVEKSGVEQVVDLERKNENLVMGYIILRHLEEFSYQFVVARQGQIIFQTDLKPSAASYVLEESLTIPGQEKIETPEATELAAESGAEAETDSDSVSESESEAVAESESEVEAEFASAIEEVMAEAAPVEAPVEAAPAEETKEDVSLTEDPIDQLIKLSQQQALPTSESQGVYKELANVIQHAAEMMREFTASNEKKEQEEIQEDSDLAMTIQMVEAPETSVSTPEQI